MQLCALVRKNELDAGMFYVLSRNMADAKEAEDEETLRILRTSTRGCRRSSRRRSSRRSRRCTAHAHVGVPIRGNILRHNLVPGGAAVDGVIKLPDGTELPVDAAKAKALVTPAAFPTPSPTRSKVWLMGVERRVLGTAEEIRQVAKERAVIEEACGGETLDAFSEALAPAFKNSLSPDFWRRRPRPTRAIERETWYFCSVAEIQEICLSIVLPVQSPNFGCRSAM